MEQHKNDHASAHEPAHAKAARSGDSMHSMNGHGEVSYGKLSLELLLDFVVMFFVMYAMIATLDHLYLNINSVYMTMMMVAPMAALMIVFMRDMYRSSRNNLIVFGLAAVLFAVGWFGMRNQLAVDDAQFVRSMIPHHSGAILMCQQADIRDPEVIQLCRGIVAAQNREIAQMQSILARLER